MVVGVEYISFCSKVTFVALISFSLFKTNKSYLLGIETSVLVSCSFCNKLPQKNVGL